MRSSELLLYSVLWLIYYSLYISISFLISNIYHYILRIIRLLLLSTLRMKGFSSYLLACAFDWLLAQGHSDQCGPPASCQETPIVDGSGDSHPHFIWFLHLHRRGIANELYLSGHSPAASFRLRFFFSMLHTRIQLCICSHVS